MADPEHLRIVRAGKTAWDSWRRTHPSERADFSETDFTVGENRDIVFSGFEFEGDADFSHTIFGNTPIPYQIHGTGHRGSPDGAALFDGVVFHKDANFRYAQFGHNARFDKTVFESRADFTNTRFLNQAEFSAAVFNSASFSDAHFGEYATFEGVLFVEGPSFENAVFGNQARFEGASFEQAFFQMARFEHQANFGNSVFMAKDTAVQFDYAVFGDGASFKGAAFECRAYFSGAEFGDYTCFDARDRIAFKDDAVTRAKILPERYRALYLDRANAAHSQAFNDISFSRVHFGEGTVNRFRSESLLDKIRLFFPRLLHSPESHRMRDLRPGPGASFRRRILQGVCDFSRVQFDQPPDFGGIGQPDNLYLRAFPF
ncbi:MAG: pentapeptide repeat-containing protein [Nitrospira sp. LK70]|nr:pentapeptide repeat-containing protein [Nitrospira sp. LK70]